MKEEGALSEYGDKEGKGLVKLFSEIKRTTDEKDPLYKLKGIHLGQLTGLINSREKVGSIIGGKVDGWNMPYVDLTWEKAMQVYFGESVVRLNPETADGFGDQAMVTKVDSQLRVQSSLPVVADKVGGIDF